VTGDPRYAAARRRAVAGQARRRPADPQTVPGGTPGTLARVAELMAPCGTEGCGHPQAEHHIPEKSARRTYCTRAGAPGRCPCDAYTPAV
jgi:hypothetical protein